MMAGFIRAYNKTFETVVKKLGNKSFTSLTSSFTNDSIENRNINNGGGDDDDDDHDDDDDEEHNNGINDINNFDYNNVEVEADNDFAMGNNDVEMPTYNSLSNYRYKPNVGRRKSKTNL
ncbi:hypothetical protein GQX74_010133 [Glossina fuscipes]|nr:hypothetical protein GQX74_010133 [Glossina fuscipes]